MRKVFLILLVSGIGLLSAQAPSPYDSLKPTGPTLDSVLGISTHLSHQPGYSREREFELGKLSEAGVSILRADFYWSELEPKDNEWHPEGYDRMINLAAEQGIRVLPILDYGVEWAMPGGSHSEIQPEDFADFAGYVAAHFGDRIQYYEVWNEPDLFIFYKPFPDPEHYGEWLKAASAAVREKDPDAKILFGGISPVESYFYGPEGSWQFLLKAHSDHPDLCQYFDLLSIHPYGFLQASSPEWGESENPIFLYDLTGAIRQARKQLEKIGCPEKEIWLTEMGWPDFLIGRDRQAAYLARSLFLAMAEGVKVYAWYTFWDSAEKSWNKEDSFGLFTWPGKNSTNIISLPLEGGGQREGVIDSNASQDHPPLNPLPSREGTEEFELQTRSKPAYDALKAAHQILGKMRYAGDLGGNLGWKNGCRALAFADDENHWAIAVWRETASPNKFRALQIPLPPGAEKWSLLNQSGKIISQGNRLSVPTLAGMEIVYLTFEWRQ